MSVQSIIFVVCFLLLILGLLLLIIWLDPKHRDTYFGKRKKRVLHEIPPREEGMSITADKLSCHSIKESQIIGGYLRQNPMGVQKMDWLVRLWSRCKVYTPHLDFHVSLYPLIEADTELWNYRYETMTMTWVSLSVRLFTKWQFRFRLYAPRDTIYRIK